MTMLHTGKKGVRRITIVYWLLLSYIIAALVWWFISLERQNEQMKDFNTRQLTATIDSLTSPELYRNELSKIEEGYRRNNIKFISEGVTFFLLILVGAAFVYRAARRQFKLHQQQENFMMAVTHELKTPISVARLNLETLQKYSLDSEKQKKLIRMTLVETERLNSLTNNILLSSQLEAEGYKSAMEELDLSDLFKDCILQFQNRYPERIFITDVEADMDVKGDTLLLQMLTNNLVENAIKYSPKEKPITCILKKNGSVQLTIADEGEGIPEVEKTKIFERFYRIGNELTRKTQGTGLGLYLCKIIAQYHNADILVTNNIPTGSNFTVTFKT
ncbi:MAG: Two-component sensor histidine kinase [Chitinophagaceae bacterium]|nr:Two-component sensor histidine kinase [Chitinophagaceae bacterium]